jgi:acyl-coenzyme A synthetase/AMP-(fatty) acid ligase
LLARRPGLRIEVPDDVLSGADVLASTAFSEPPSAFAGKSVLIGARSLRMSARALLELDGLAARLVICPPDFSGNRLANALDQAKVDVVVSDVPRSDVGGRNVARLASPRPRDEGAPVARVSSEWVLPTSGTTGAPKLVEHRLAGLLGAIDPSADTPVWATFYDIRRYGGLQIFLRACVAGGTLVLTEAHEALPDFLARCKAAQVSHMSGTPSHWRRLLMSPHVAEVAPRNVRLSGEIADAAILGALRDAFPTASIVHAYASTEAGVGFEVRDGREGFPAAFLGGLPDVDLRLIDGALHLRSQRAARGYVGREDLALRDTEGFVDTGDIVERIGDRCFFRGRRSGAINVGGLKVHPEEVERVINMHEEVRMSRVFARKNPIMGDLIAAEIVLTDAGASRPQTEVREEVLTACRNALPRHMAPASVKIVPALEVTAAGKLARAHA